jgi:serine/threonine protein kinase/Tol biopolymer transport system component
VSLTPGTRLGAYEVLTLIGAGGMGEVYRARDARLGRDVAIKVLPAGVVGDPERLQRFEQEARAAAALNHPNILAVHDIGQHDGAPYIVAELLDGETLRERLNGGALPVRKAVEYAIQIAHGLAAAHEKGIVHRDLKPENIFVTTDDRVKILDFGLAKLTQAEPALSGGSALPTTPPHTLPGIVLGTVGYMAPEQVRGLATDHRSDIFAFGAILYEMVSGQRAFRGDTTMDAMSAILVKDPPDLPVGEQHISPALARLVDRCLEKRPAARFQSTEDLAFALEAFSSHSGATEAVTSRPRTRSRERIAWIAAGLTSLGLIAALPFAIAYLRDPQSEPEAVRFSVAPPSDATFAGGPFYAPAQALSPDGRVVVFRARRGAQDLLWVRPLNSLDARPLTGTDGGDFPFWSPDSRFIGFFAEGKLKKVDASGGPVQLLCDAPAGEGGSWNQDGIIVFAASGDAGLSRVSAAGGQPTALTTLDASRKEISHRWPEFLPDGRRFLFLVRPGTEVRVGSLDSSETKTVLNADSKVLYTPPGHLVFVRQGTLMAQSFDAARAQPVGDPFPIAEQVLFFSTNGRAAFSVSENGVLAYRTGLKAAAHMAWVDRAGRLLQSFGEPADYQDLSLSPDDTRVVVHRHESQGGGGLWLLDWKRGTASRFTFNSHEEQSIWSPDGTRIAFASERDGPISHLYQNMASGAGQVELLFKSNTPKKPTNWSHDGRFIVYENLDPKTGDDIWVLPLFGDRKPIPFLRTQFSEGQGQLSPDGRWMAYASNETGRYEVYVQPFPPSGAKWLISPGGGGHPRWRRDGKELFYLALAGGTGEIIVMAAEPTASVSGFGAGTPKALFKTTTLSLLANLGPFGDQVYSVSADGQRFIFLTPVAQSQPVTVVLNWPALVTK